MTKWERAAFLFLTALLILGVCVLCGARTVNRAQPVQLVDVDGTTYTAWEE